MPRVRSKVQGILRAMMNRIWIVKNIEIRVSLFLNISITKSAINRIEKMIKNRGKSGQFCMQANKISKKKIAATQWVKSDGLCFNSAKEIIHKLIV